MPIYEYKCKVCDNHFDVEQKISARPLTKMKGCEVAEDGQHQLKKVFSAVGISFKGEGFYRNDSRGKKSSSGSESSSGDSSSSSSSESTSSSNGSSDSSSSSSSTSSDSSSSSSSSSDSSTSSKDSAKSPTKKSGKAKT